MGEDKDHSIEGNTEVPAGLDVVPTVPGTIVGSHDLQGADGKERTDRPGDILGTPIPHEDTSARDREKDKADFVRQEVDRANREDLPKLGGQLDDGWTRDAAVTSTEKAKAVAKDKG